MPQDHRPPGGDIIDVPVAIHIIQIGALRPLDEQRRPSYTAERTDRRIDAPRNALLALSKSSLLLVYIDS
jgi:hypothetical protein